MSTSHSGIEKERNCFGLRYVVGTNLQIAVFYSCFLAHTSIGLRKP